MVIQIDHIMFAAKMSMLSTAKNGVLVSAITMCTPELSGSMAAMEAYIEEYLQVKNLLLRYKNLLAFDISKIRGMEQALMEAEAELIH